MKILIVIPARGGSKGIPRKNLQLVGGVPLIERTLRAANAALGERSTVVSTDDSEIAELVERLGGWVLRRPAELATDEASSESVLLHAIDGVREAHGFTPEVLIFLQCTSPFTTAEDIRGTLMTMVQRDADCAFTAVPWQGHLWGRADGRFIGINHAWGKRQRRQDRPPQWIETGAVYAMRVPGFLEAKHRFFGKVVAHEVPQERALEIDTPYDLHLAQLLAREAVPA